MALLQLKNITVQFGGLTAVNNLDLDIEKGQIFALIGPNGAGKTTVLNVISRFYTPVKGEFLFEGENMLKQPAHKVISKGIARSFQNVELFKKMTVLDNLLTGLHPKMKNNVFTAAFSFPWVKREETEAVRRAEEVLELLGLSAYKGELVKNLSFGTQKMVDIGRAIMSRPKLILLDEPVAGMNAIETEKVGDLIVRLRDEFGITVMMIEHDMSLVMKISDKIAVIDFGQKIAEGTAKEVQNNPKVIEAYLGESDNIA